MKTFVKICGITSVQALDAVISTEADAIGFVIGVPDSPRNLSLYKARELRKRVPDGVKSIIVMVPDSLKEVLDAIHYIEPDMIQLHNSNFDTSPIEIPIIKSLNQRTCLFEARQLASTCDLLLLDSYHDKLYGGTGQLQDLRYSKIIIQRLKPQQVILAGGLTPGNVSEVIKHTEPYGVDVSSGVESSPGIKDAKKICDFVKKVKGIGDEI